MQAKNKKIFNIQYVPVWLFKNKATFEIISSN